MILTGSDGKEYEFDSSLWGNGQHGILKPVEKEAKEWPQVGSEYWYIDSEGVAYQSVWQARYNTQVFTGIHRTKKEAQHAADRIRSLKDANLMYTDVYTGDPTLIEVCFIIPKKYLKAWKYLESEEK